MFVDRLSRFKSKQIIFLKYNYEGRQFQKKGNTGEILVEDRKIEIENYFDTALYTEQRKFKMNFKSSKMKFNLQNNDSIETCSTRKDTRFSFVTFVTFYSCILLTYFFRFPI